MGIINQGIADKQLFISTIILFVIVVVLIIYVLRTTGREAVLTLIRKAEYLFDLKGKGKEKLQYVIDNAKSFVPAPYKWFISIELINKLVSMLQPEFKADKDMKKGE